jgi:eukaryotic-like serine/threonine-protein kinase
LVDPESSLVALSSEHSMGLAASIVDGRYRLGAVMAVTRDVVVYAADDTTAGRQVALEILRDEVAADADFVAAVSEQARKLASPACAHRTVARVYDCGVTDAGVLFVALERTVGRTLREILETRGPLDPYNALRIAIQIGEALEVLHHRGIIHGELRPESVVLVRGEGATDQAKLVGVELMAAHRTAIGARRRDPTLLSYLAPEQIERAETTEAADVHALGRLLRDLLTAEPSRESRTSRPLAAAVPATIENIIASALHERPDQRYSDVTLMLNDMWGAQIEFEDWKSRPRPVQRPALPQIQWPRMGRRELGIAAIGAGGIALAALVWVTTSHGLVSKLRFRAPLPAFTTAPVEREATLPSGATLTPAETRPSSPPPAPAAPTADAPRPPAPPAAATLKPAETPRPAVPPSPAATLKPAETLRPAAPPSPAATLKPAETLRPAAPPPPAVTRTPVPSPAPAERRGVPDAVPTAPPSAKRIEPAPTETAAAPATGATRRSPAETPPPAPRPAPREDTGRDGADGTAIIDWLMKGRR